MNAETDSLRRPARRETVAMRLAASFRPARLLALVALAHLAACYAAPLAIAPTGNPQIDVELLFEHDGCRVYRFRDGARPIYYSDCRGSTAWNVSCGRNCTQPVAVNTLR